jgi:hypothetical protein
VIKVEGHRIESLPLKTVPDDFYTYYERELQEKGWSLSEFADGPVGDRFGYERDGHYFAYGKRFLLVGSYVYVEFSK